jgi:hypothetical protein
MSAIASSLLAPYYTIAVASLVGLALVPLLGAIIRREKEQERTGGPQPGEASLQTPA